MGADFDEQDRLERLEAAMRRLSPMTRTIFLAIRLHGLSYAEVAGRTGLSVKKVEWHMAIALAAIDRELSRQMD